MRFCTFVGSTITLLSVAALPASATPHAEVESPTSLAPSMLSGWTETRSASEHQGPQCSWIREIGATFDTLYTGSYATAVIDEESHTVTTHAATDAAERLQIRIVASAPPNAYALEADSEHQPTPVIIVTKGLLDLLRSR
ncbi:MAG: hypothetical protein KDD69_20315, partial [Bdellovibrionales bacterium]|nr:hypothetical protein [Bdellovibrionales bacterium]